MKHKKRMRARVTLRRVSAIVYCVIYIMNVEVCGGVYEISKQRSRKNES